MCENARYISCHMIPSPDQSPYLGEPDRVPTSKALTPETFFPALESLVISSL